MPHLCQLDSCGTRIFGGGKQATEAFKVPQVIPGAIKFENSCVRGLLMNYFIFSLQQSYKVLIIIIIIGPMRKKSGAQQSHKGNIQQNQALKILE